jgi:hypothetical protein
VTPPGPTTGMGRLRPPGAGMLGRPEVDASGAIHAGQEGIHKPSWWGIAIMLDMDGKRPLAMVLTGLRTRPTQIVDGRKHTGGHAFPLRSAQGHSGTGSPGSGRPRPSRAVAALLHPAAPNHSF